MAEWLASVSLLLRDAPQDALCTESCQLCPVLVSAENARHCLRDHSSVLIQAGRSEKRSYQLRSTEREFQKRISLSGNYCPIITFQSKPSISHVFIIIIRFKQHDEGVSHHVGRPSLRCGTRVSEGGAENPQEQQKHQSRWRPRRRGHVAEAPARLAPFVNPVGGVFELGIRDEVVLLSNHLDGQSRLVQVPQ